jgi:hypothetical protein
VDVAAPSCRRSSTRKTAPKPTAPPISAPPRGGGRRGRSPPIDPEPSRRAVLTGGIATPEARRLMLDTAGIWRVDAPPGPTRRPARGRGRWARRARCWAGSSTSAGPRRRRGSTSRRGANPQTEAIAAEIRRDHLMQIFMAWPRALGLTPHVRPRLADRRHGGAPRAVRSGRPRPAQRFRDGGFPRLRRRRRPAPAPDRRGLRPPHGGDRWPALVDAETAFRSGGRRKLPRRAAGRPSGRWPMSRRCTAAARSGARWAG